MLLVLSEIWGMKQLHLKETGELYQLVRKLSCSCKGLVGAVVWSWEENLWLMQELKMERQRYELLRQPGKPLNKLIQGDYWGLIRPSREEKKEWSFRKKKPPLLKVPSISLSGSPFPDRLLKSECVSVTYLVLRFGTGLMEGGLCDKAEMKMKRQYFQDSVTDAV